MQSHNNRAYMHDYCNIFAFIHNFTPTNVGVFLFIKMCKMNYFLYFATTDVVTLTRPFHPSQHHHHHHQLIDLDQNIWFLINQPFILLHLIHQSTPIRPNIYIRDLALMQYSILNSLPKKNVCVYTLFLQKIKEYDPASSWESTKLSL